VNTGSDRSNTGSSPTLCVKIATILKVGWAESFSQAEYVRPFLKRGNVYGNTEFSNMNFILYLLNKLFLFEYFSKFLFVRDLIIF